MEQQPFAIKTLTINGCEVSARSGDSILKVAREHGIWIPTLCYLEGLSAYGSCRLCVVEVAGSNRLHAACVTSVYEGMVVSSETPRLQHYRKMIIELLLSERPHVCAVCVSNGHCELQATTQSLGVTSVRYPYLNRKFAVDASDRRFLHDDNRCILCGRCVRVCSEIEGAHTWEFGGRGLDTCVVTDLALPWGQSETCTGCSKCVHVCPTGALIEKGRSMTEQAKRRCFLPYLTVMRREDKS